MAMLPVAQHLNSIRESMQRYVVGSLRRVKGMGNDIWETIGFLGCAAAAFAEFLIGAKQQGVSALVERSDVPGDCRALGMSWFGIVLPGGEALIPMEPGNGATRFAAIFKAGTEGNVQRLLVEQDQARRDPMESARMNAACLRIHLF